MKIEIRGWRNQEVIICGKYESIKDCLQKNKGKSLQGADLQGADLQGADLQGADLQGADLWRADLRGANLQGADLQGANLQGADLWRADLWRADLWRADLRRADLQGADLRGAKNFNKYTTTPLYGMLDQPGKIIAYKIVNNRNEGIYNGGLVYTIGATIEEKGADTNEFKNCGEGINLATLDWCMREWKPGYKILLAEFTKEDIACIPVGSDGKFRVYRCRIIGEKNLKESGLLEAK